MIDFKNCNGGVVMREFLQRCFLTKKRIIALVIVLLFFLLAYGWYSSKYMLSSSYYTINSNQFEKKVRIVQLTDLHNSEFGMNNEQLVNQVAELKPDLILITGDLLNSDVQNTEIAVGLINRLSEIASVYFSMGNHEYEYEKNFGTDIVELYESAGAIVLEKQYRDVEVNGQQLRIGGIYGYCLPEKYLNETNPEECAFLSDFQDTDLYTILLTHMPVCWLLNEGLSEWDVDCVLSGHVHGGQVIFPFAGGLYAPDFGWFPGKVQGLYYSENKEKALVLSRGLGSTERIPRFNNVPEIVVVDLLPQ